MAHHITTGYYRSMKSSTGNRLKERRRAIGLLRRGNRPSSVARRLGVSRSSLFRWRKVYQQAGEEGLALKPIPGRPRNLSPEQEKKLSQELKRKLELYEASPLENSLEALEFWRREPPSPTRLEAYHKALNGCRAALDAWETGWRRGHRNMAYVAKIVLAVSGVKYHRGHLWRILKRIGWQYSKEDGWLPKGWKDTQYESAGRIKKLLRVITAEG